MTILDSDVWIAYFNTNDSQHLKARKVFEKISDKIILTEYNILEISSVLLLRASKAVADSFLDIVLNNADIAVLASNEHFFNRVIKRFLEFKKSSLSFVDVSLVVLSKEYEVVTFDEKLKKVLNVKF